MPAAAHTRSQGSRRDPQLKRLLIRPGAIGDLIVSLPALEHCRGRYTEVWVAEQNVPLIRFADRVRSIGSTGLDLLELGVDTHVLVPLESFDSIISWYGAARPEFRDSVAGLPFTFHDALPRTPDCHATDFYTRQVGGPDGAVPSVDAGPVRRRDVIAIHPFSGSARKNWPIENYRALAGLLPYPVELCAGPKEALDGAVRFESLLDVARWLKSARAYVGNDSGITHLAAAVGVPVIAIFQTTDPRVWAPRGDVSVLSNPTVEQVRELLVARCHEHGA